LKEQAITTPADNKIFEYELIGNGGIWWNSTYYMIQHAIKLQSAINLYIYHWQKLPTNNNAYDLK